MRSILSAIVVSWSLAFGTSPANAELIYEVLGVYDDGGATNTGIATTIYCSNLTANAVDVRVAIIDADGVFVAAKKVSIGGLLTAHWVTHETAGFVSPNLNTGRINARARIFTEVPSAIVCAADLTNAAQDFAASPTVPRRMIRYPRAARGGED
jgi:hypothetical protein